jgi:hypothetical protein
MPDYPYHVKDVRKEPDDRELRILIQPSIHEGGLKEMPAPAKKFAARFAANVTHFPAKRELPNWFKAMIEKKVSVEELTKTLQEHVFRAPSEENQELALIVANEISRMKGGSEILPKYITPELLTKLSGKGGE